MKLIKKKPNDKCDACGEKADERFTFLIVGNMNVNKVIIDNTQPIGQIKYK